MSRIPSGASGSPEAAAAKAAHDVLIGMASQHRRRPSTPAYRR